MEGRDGYHGLMQQNRSKRPGTMLSQRGTRGVEQTQQSIHAIRHGTRGLEHGASFQGISCHVFRLHHSGLVRKTVFFFGFGFKGSERQSKQGREVEKLGEIMGTG